MTALAGGWAALVALGLVLGAARRSDRRVEERLASLGPSRVAAAAPEGTSRRALLAAAGAAAGLLLGGGSWWTVPLSLVLGAAAFRLPGMVAARREGARREAIARAVPDLLDVLAMCVAAGLGPEASLRLAADTLGGPLSEELARTLDLVGVGTRWRDALADLAGRSGSADLRRLGDAMTQADTVGTSLGSALRELAAESRAVRRAAAEARARAAPVKLLFPLALLILPAFLLLTVVPVVLATLRNL